MFLFDIDEDKSRQQADRLLKQYWRVKHIAGSASHLKSPTYNHAPKSSNNINNAENKTIQAIEARKTLENVEYTLEQLPDNYVRLLRMRYLNAEKLTVIYICMELSISEGTFRRHKKLALIEFAEAYPNGELLVYRE